MTIPPWLLKAGSWIGINVLFPAMKKWIMDKYRWIVKKKEYDEVSRKDQERTDAYEQNPNANTDADAP